MQFYAHFSPSRSQSVEFIGFLSILLSVFFDSLMFSCCSKYESEALSIFRAAHDSELNRRINSLLEKWDFCASCFVFPKKFDPLPKLIRFFLSFIACHVHFLPVIQRFFSACKNRENSFFPSSTGRCFIHSFTPPLILFPRVWLAHWIEGDNDLSLAIHPGSVCHASVKTKKKTGGK